MTAATSINLIGREALLRMESLSIVVTICDIKSAWGRERYLVRPVTGEGEQWVEAGRFILSGQ